VTRVTAGYPGAGNPLGRRASMLARTDLMFAVVVLLGLATTILTFS
jgi:hypothetical protein